MAWVSGVPMIVGPIGEHSQWFSRKNVHCGRHFVHVGDRRRSLFHISRGPIPMLWQGVVFFGFESRRLTANSPWPMLLPNGHLHCLFLRIVAPFENEWHGHISGHHAARAIARLATLCHRRGFRSLVSTAHIPIGKTQNASPHSARLNPIPLN